MSRFLLCIITLGCILLASDATITSTLRAKLAKSKLHTDPIKFSVKDSVVEWTGSVTVPQRKGAATRMAKTAGAKRVVNHISIAHSAMPSKAPTASPRPVSVQIPKPR